MDELLRWLWWFNTQDKRFRDIFEAFVYGDEDAINYMLSEVDFVIDQKDAASNKPIHIHTIVILLHHKSDGLHCSYVRLWTRI
jgi:hypothetical protein